MQESPLIKSVFIPDSSLQGSSIPIHVTWNPKKKVDVMIYYPFECMHLTEVHNAKKGSLLALRDGMRIQEFEVNGYLGLSFETKVNKNQSISIPITIIVKSIDGEREIIERKILFFRQRTVLIEQPDKIEVALDKEDNLFFSKKISVRNEGKGTALISLQLKEGGKITITVPEDISRYVNKFKSTLEAKFGNLKEKYPSYSTLLDQFLSVMKAQPPASKEEIAYVGKIIEGINKAFEENNELAEDFLEAIISSYYASVNLITEIDTFQEFLKSIASKKIILHNALSFLKIEPGQNKLNAKLVITDLESNIYEPIEINTEIFLKTEVPIKIPLYSIFDWLDHEGDVLEQ